MTFERDEVLLRRLSREYCTIQSIRDEGVAVGDLSDDRAKHLIRLMSAIIDRLTGQWFVPEEMRVLRDGDRSRIVYLKSRIKILEIESNGIVLLSRGDLTSLSPEVLTVDEYVVSDRWVELTDSPYSWGSINGFPKGIKNIQITGVFGWVEPQSNKIETITSTDITSASVTVDVVSAKEFRKGDVVLFVDSNGNAARVILTSVDYTGNKLGFEAQAGLPVTVVSGATAKTWGPVPEAIARAVTTLVIQNRAQLSSSSTVSASVLAGQIKSEATDNYRYEKFGEEAKKVASDVTGLELLDGVLEEYSAPMPVEWC